MATSRVERMRVTREDVSNLLDSIVSLQGTGIAPYVGLDECVNNPNLVETVASLCNRRLASAAGPLWNQRQVRRDGSIIYQMGGRSKSQPQYEFLGMPVEEITWDDEKVLTLLLAHFHSFDRLVLLTGNHAARDRNGLARLLRHVVSPVLSERHRQRFSLTVLFKKGTMDFREYAARVVHFFETAKFEYGCKEVRL